MDPLELLASVAELPEEVVDVETLVCRYAYGLLLQYGQLESLALDMSTGECYEGPSNDVVTAAQEDDPTILEYEFLSTETYCMPCGGVFFCFDEVPEQTGVVPVIEAGHADLHLYSEEDGEVTNSSQIDFRQETHPQGVGIFLDYDSDPVEDEEVIEIIYNYLTKLGQVMWWGLIMQVDSKLKTGPEPGLIAALEGYLAAQDE